MNALRHWEPVVVDRLPGSLPMGGVVPDTPVHAFRQSPESLCFEPRLGLQPERHEIDCDSALAFRITQVVNAEEADAIVAASEFFGFRPEAPGISTPPGMRMNKSVHWVADEALFGELLGRIRSLLPPEIEGRPLGDRLSHRLNVYKYDRNDVFNRHIDGDWPGFGLSGDRQTMVQWPGLHSCLSMLLYLNGEEDGVEGGATRLFGRQGKVIDVAPRKGDALFFQHGFSVDSVMHEGRPVTGASAKYLARINVLYGARL